MNKSRQYLLINYSPVLFFKCLLSSLKYLTSNAWGSLSQSPIKMPIDKERKKEFYNPENWEWKTSTDNEAWS